MPQGIDFFQPFLMPHDIDEARVAFEIQAEKIPGLAFVPIRRMNDGADAGDGGFGLIEAQTQVDLLAGRLAIEDVPEQPIRGGFFDNQTGKVVFHVVDEPSAKLQELVPVAFHITLGQFCIDADIDLPMPTFGNGFRKIYTP